mgnify:CR=1 FL=1
MDYLWSPWRYRYVTKAGGAAECIFCAKAAASDDTANLIVHRGERAFVLMNLYPYTTGHLMVAPYEHIATLAEASPEIVCDVILLTRRAERCLASVLRPHGYNIGMNLGECAGAGVAGHIHMHVVPRWAGDSSFMTTVGETRVIPEDLETTYGRILSAWNGGE